VGRPSSNFLTR